MTNKEKLNEAFRLIKEVADDIGINLLDNYSYREYTSVEILKQYLPSIKKTIGRTGDDAVALEENYYHIEQKSGTDQNKTLTLKSFPKMMFDKQSDSARRKYIFNYDGFSLSYFEYCKPYPAAMIFVPKEHVPKLHSLFETKQNQKVLDFEKRIAEGKNIGHDAITITLTDIIECVKIENLVCWLHGSRIDPTDFFNKLTNKEIKINQ
jgi:hypothetical protein